MLPEHAAWPWGQITNDAATQAKYDADAEYATAKRQIDQDFGREKLTKAWIKTCAGLSKLTEEVKEKKAGIFPVLEMDDVVNGRIEPEQISEIRRVGSVIVKNVIPQSEVERTYSDLKDYIAQNKSDIDGYPHESPSIYCVYNTPTQNYLRSHPKLVQLMSWVNNSWDYQEDGGETSPDPLVYADRLRIRGPGVKFLGLGPHIDSGGLCRWTEPNYRNFYAEVFEGNPEKLNCFDMSKRKNADQGYYTSALQSTVLRSFQGWTALTETAPREGTIILYPNVQLVMAYILLRPFFRPPEDETKILNAEDWTYDANSNWFPGITRNGDNNLSPSSHPHLRLEDNFLHAPALQAGDTVWWHSDVCHAVDPDHEGKVDASVAYIAATPTTKTNKAHMRNQYDKMAAGLPPPDYNDGIDESKLKGFQGFSGKEEVFKALMGY